MTKNKYNLGTVCWLIMLGGIVCLLCALFLSRNYELQIRKLDEKNRQEIENSKRIIDSLLVEIDIKESQVDTIEIIITRIIREKEKVIESIPYLPLTEQIKQFDDLTYIPDLPPSQLSEWDDRGMVAVIPIRRVTKALQKLVELEYVLQENQLLNEGMSMQADIIADLKAALAEAQSTNKLYGIERQSLLSMLENTYKQRNWLFYGLIAALLLAAAT